MDKQIIKVNTGSITFPAYYQKVDSMPGDPENSMPYEVQTPNAVCIAFISAEDYSKALPREQNESITTGARMNLSEQEEFDEKFPGFPLSMCKELVKYLTEEE